MSDAWFLVSVSRYVLCTIALAWALGSIGSVSAADDWPQWMGPQRDGVWREDGIIESFPDGGPHVMWRVPVHGGYAGPAVADGRVIVTDYERLEGDGTPNPGYRNPLRGNERVLCFDIENGELLWKYEYPRDYAISYPAGPRATPTIDGDRVYILGAEGNFTCLKVEDGSLVWSRDLRQDYGLRQSPIWGYASHPLVHENLVYTLVGGPDSIVVAFDKMTGDEVWRALSASEIGYCPPTLIEAGGTQQLIVWHAESVNSLNPATGEIHWSVPLQPSFGMSIVAPYHWEDYLFVAGIEHQSLLLRLDPDRPAATEVWREKPIGPVHSPALIHDGYLYAIDRMGQLRCIELETGERVWETLRPTTGERPGGSATAFMVRHEERWIIASETGDLIIARLSPEGYEELDRVHLLQPTTFGQQGRTVVWSAPAFSQRSIFWRNDRELIRVDLSAE